MTEQDLSITLESGWTLSAPPGTSQAALELVAEELNDGDTWIRTPDEAEDAVADRERPAPPEAQDFLPPSLVDRLHARLTAPSPLAEMLFNPQRTGASTVVYEQAGRADQAPAGTWVVTDTRGGHTWVKRRFVDHPRAHHWSYTGPVYEDEAAWFGRPVAGELTRETLELIRRWCFRLPDRPGWSGSITGPPRPIPEAPQATWSPARGVIGTDGRKHKLGGPAKDRTILVEPGADSNPHARLMEFDQDGKLHDVGPAYPNGLSRHRAPVPPIAWDSPLADPLGDLRRHAAPEGDR